MAYSIKAFSKAYGKELCAFTLVYIFHALAVIIVHTLQAQYADIVDLKYGLSNNRVCTENFPVVE